jgi:hypothetical protein
MYIDESTASKVNIMEIIDERVFENKTGEKIIMLPDTDAAPGRDVRLSNLSHCTVLLLDFMGALRMDNIDNCNIYAGPIAG